MINGDNMKKTYILLFFIFTFIFMPKINALCEDKELNSWAEKASIIKKEYKSTGLVDENGDYVWTGDLSYAYLLTPSIPRDDIYMTATNSEDSEVQKSEYIYGYDIIAIGEYNNLNEVKFTVNVYGSEKSACPNELIKTQKVIIPPLNKYVTSEFCDKYPEHENCQAYKDTSNISQEEFIKEAEKYDKEHGTEEDDRTYKERLLDDALEYGFYILIPIIVISVYYTIRINKFKKEEREK